MATVASGFWEELPSAVLGARCSVVALRTISGGLIPKAGEAFITFEEIGGRFWMYGLPGSLKLQFPFVLPITLLQSAVNHPGNAEQACEN
jgi:hypothetical protein